MGSVVNHGGIPLWEMVFEIQSDELLLARNDAQLGDGFAAGHFLQMRVYVPLIEHLLHL